MKICLKVFVTPSSLYSESLLSQIEDLQRKFSSVDFEIDIVDVIRNPALAEGEEITVTPTIVRMSPTPIKRIVANFDSLESALGLNQFAGRDYSPQMAVS